MSRIDKKRENIKEVNMHLHIGERAIIQKLSGQWYMTSPVVAFSKEGEKISIETQNSIYILA